MVMYENINLFLIHTANIPKSDPYKLFSCVPSSFGGVFLRERINNLRQSASIRNTIVPLEFRLM